MPSPFPGMDPYLEDLAFWPDFHARFVVYLREAIGDLLPHGYEARLNVRIVPEEHVSQRSQGDGVAANAPPRPSLDPPAGKIEPRTIPLQVFDGPRQTFIQIRRHPSRELVTVIEVLSPSNKSDVCRSAYLSVRNELILGDVNLVEVDLLLNGQRPPLRGRYPAGDYFALVSRADNGLKCDVYAWNIHRPLPSIPIPLGAPTPDVWIDLAALLASAYAKGRYDRSLDYKLPPPITLPEHLRTWIADYAKSASK